MATDTRVPPFETVEDVNRAYEDAEAIALAEVHTAVVSANPVVRWAWAGGGTMALSLGLVGVVVPGWPTTIFLIIAAACYARSSQRMYNWVINNRLFGRHVKKFRETGVMPPRAKAFALGVMWPFVLLSVFVFIPDHVMVAKLATLALAAIGTAYILWLPSHVQHPRAKRLVPTT